MFEPLYDVTRTSIIDIFALVFIYSFAVALVLFLVASFLREKWAKPVLVLACSGVFTGIMAACIMVVTLFVTEDIASDEALENNLKQKYDIAKVIDDDPKYKVSSALETEQFIQVETTDGKKAVFFLTQNMNTFEPTLHELVDNGIAGPVALKDITK